MGGSNNSAELKETIGHLCGRGLARKVKCCSDGKGGW